MKERKSNFELLKELEDEWDVWVKLLENHADQVFVTEVDLLNQNEIIFMKEMKATEIESRIEFAGIYTLAPIEYQHQKLLWNASSKLWSVITRNCEEGKFRKGYIQDLALWKKEIQ